jgi:hypothetical protein
LAPRKAGRTKAFQRRKLLRVSCCAGGAPKAAARAELDIADEFDELMSCNLKTEKQSRVVMYRTRAADRLLQQDLYEATAVAEEQQQRRRQVVVVRVL